MANCARRAGGWFPVFLTRFLTHPNSSSLAGEQPCAQQCNSSSSPSLHFGTPSDVDLASTANFVLRLRTPNLIEEMETIVFIHGLGGHPYKTWACPRRKNIPTSFPRNTNQSSPDGRGFFPRLFSKIGCCDGGGDEDRDGDGATALEDKPPRRVASDDSPPDRRRVDGDVYWPYDLLAGEDHCRNVRILTYGYDSKVTKGLNSTNQNNLFAHAKDLLYALQREKPARRSVIFVAHSLGGLLVKEALRRSESSEEAEFKDIVKSTKGVIFLGTPHRGSPGMADLGQTVRSIASTILRVDSNAVLLRTLGTDSPELELGRESFTTLWRKYGFRVKTFQEAWGLSGINAGPLNNKVVPDTSSTLDDPREHAETISANHMNMCRFETRLDAGYRKISLEIGSMIALGMIVRMGEVWQHVQQWTVPRFLTMVKAFLESLAFAEMDNRLGNIQRALDDTCDWLYSTTEYNAWINNTDVAKVHGLLWIKGKPGSGKSTLMKDAVRRVKLLYEGTQTTTAAFFFNARGTGDLEKTPFGLYRSLLYQVLCQDSLALDHLCPVFRQKAMFHPIVTWHQEELRDLLSRVFATCESRPAIVFIDAMDECNDDEVRDLIRFFKHLGNKAYNAGADLKICFSSRHYPHISINGCPEIVVEDNNRTDILRYIVAEAEDNRSIADLKDEIFERSCGVFLWVVLAIAMLGQHGRGKSLKLLQQKLREIPPVLSTLFRTLFSNQDPAEAERAVRLIQLILFSMQPLTQNQIHQALAFGGTRYGSLATWKDSVEYLETRVKIHEMIIDLSKGLLEQTPSSASQDPTYQFIHETVREFFLHGNGFSLLYFSSTSIVGSGHSMMATCFANYLEVQELRPATAGKCELPANDPDLALLAYICVRIFDHIEAAEEQGISQEGVLRRLSDDTCELLRRLAASPFTTRYQPGSTILVAAIDFGVIKTANRILRMGFSVNQQTATPLGYALHTALSGRRRITETAHVYRGSTQLQMVDLLLQNGADVSLKNQFGQRALHIAATRRPEVVLAILDKKPNVNPQDVDGETPLHRAIHSAHYYLRIVEILLAHGARVDIRNRRGETPLDVSRSRVAFGDISKDDGLVTKLMEEHAGKARCGI
ncbi:hypothetical protein CHGG_10108 [Chaetomium globosum CBS 148.51]|uniref:Nephrocystin 3-like N-terminal domain-containing protein n=1 Tax=Chaetomium globosum (strain ATCC 6205 / CBS 148.51 / DSM 1962 / NBRC 6347 / NRRL 1970) TaxID=306901 RepID=Q2GPJ6_CHAGB|nr:uncharacterized protein CHGG_10108 [Chaetomium globosum CBS 148.51]EAQ83704.1 hypothetical protein CHGG_10108 [Chaetomium globosum CBS 148.51]